MTYATEPKTHVAKNNHRCDWCWELINKGETYKRYRWYDGGEASTVKMHPECFEASGELAREWNEDIEFIPGEHERPGKENRDD